MRKCWRRKVLFVLAAAMFCAVRHHMRSRNRSPSPVLAWRVKHHAFHRLAIGALSE